MRIFSYIFALFFLLGSCTQPAQKQQLDVWMSDNGKKKVLCTTSFIQSVVERIASGEVDTLALIQGELDPHSYQLVKGDDEKLLRADLIFYNGLGLEHGPNLLKYLVESDKTRALGDYIAQNNPDEMIYLDSVIDPHVWMNVHLWKQAIVFVRDELTFLVPEKKDVFFKNAKELTKELTELHAYMKETLHKIPSEKRYLVTTHDAFNYFARAYLTEKNELDNDSWQIRCQAPEGLAPDSQLSTADIQRLVDHIIEYRISAVFAESNISRDSIKKLVSACQKFGNSVHIPEKPLYADALGKKGSDADTYQKMMKYNAQTIAEELKKNHGSNGHAKTSRTPS